LPQYGGVALKIRYQEYLCSFDHSACQESHFPSVMFDPPEKTIIATPPLERQSTGDRCEELLRKAEALKGKPQRRHAALERYRKECGQAPP
jgi:hypothetical protein